MGGTKWTHVQKFKEKKSGSETLGQKKKNKHKRAIS